MERKSFFSLPREIRDQIYKLCLLSTEPLQPLTLTDRSWADMGGFSPRLFRASKAVHAEACAVFYGQNRFEFPDPFLHWNLDEFLENIGSSAAYLGHALIPFPRTECLMVGGTTLDSNDLGIAASLRRRCPNLKTLSTEYMSTYATLELNLMGQEPALRRDALAVIDAHFRSLPSLQRIIVQMHEGSLADAELRGGIEGMGWVICTEDEREDRLNNGRAGRFRYFVPSLRTVGSAHTIDTLPEDAHQAEEDDHADAVSDDGDEAWVDTDSDSDLDSSDWQSDDYDSDPYGDHWGDNFWYAS